METLVYTRYTNPINKLIFKLLEKTICFITTSKTHKFLKCRLSIPPLFEDFKIFKIIPKSLFSKYVIQIDKLVVDGGVAQNDFILQYIADLTGEKYLSHDA